MLAAALLLLLLAGCTSGEAPDGETTGQALEADPVLNIAHRGASGHAPENTFAAYDLALERGADYIEQDVRMTKDGALIVFHDENLGRSARGPAGSCQGPVGEKTLAQIETCEVGTSFNERHPRYAREEYEGAKIPTLEEVFQRYREEANFYIDLKDPGAPGIEKELLRLMEEHGLRESSDGRWRVIVVSFSEFSLRTLHDLEPSLPLTRAYPASEDAESITTTLDETREYAAGINPWRDAVDRALVKATHDRCLRVYPYKADTKPALERLVSLGVDGIFTGFPDRLDEVLDEKTETVERTTGFATERHASCQAQ